MIARDRTGARRASLMLSVVTLASSLWIGAAAAQEAQPVEPAPPPPAGPKVVLTEITRPGNWQVTCNTLSDKTRNCIALLQLLEKEQRRVVFSWSLGFDEKRAKVARFEFPTGVQIKPGLILRAAENNAVRVPIDGCDANQCYAVPPLNAAMLKVIRDRPNLTAVLTNTQGGTVEIPIDATGLEEAYKAVFGEG